MRDLLKGLLRENPIFVLMLGLCPSLAVSTSVNNALGMGAATFVVLVGSNLMISLLRRQIPDDIHIPAYIVIISAFVTTVDLLLQAYLPALSKSLGIYIPLIVVNCIILGRAEAFASRNTVAASVKDGIAMGLGFIVGLTAIALVREVLGAGTITIVPDQIVLAIPLLSEKPALVFAFPAGALIVVGFLQGFLRWMVEVRSK